MEKRFSRFTLLRLEPRTGRLHQIRVHLSAIGHPIVGDKIYGPDESLYIEFIQSGFTERHRRVLLLPRHALHAAEIAFTHPMTREPVHASSPLPDDLTRFIQENLPL